MIQAISLLIFCLPLYMVRFSVGSIPFTLLEVVILLLFAWWVAQGGYRISNWKISRAMLLWVVVLLVASGISLAVTPHLREGLGLWKAYIVEPMLLFLVVVHSIRTRQAFTAVIWSLAGVSLIISVIALVQYFTGWGIPEPWQAIEARRSTAFYGYPNAIGLFVAPITAALIGWVIHQWKTLFVAHRVVLLGIIVLNVLGLFAARVEGGIIAVAAALGVMLLFTRFRWYAVAAGVITLIGLFAYTPTRDLLLFNDVSGDVRIALWKGTAALIADRPLVGTGLAGFPTVYDEYRLASHVELLQYPHNIFLDFWVELGLIGLFWIVGTLVWWFTKLFQYRHSARPAALTLLGVLVCIIVYGLVDVPYFKNDLAALFWIWLALVYTLPHRN